ncbi:MAG: SMI1/KNR4 family protein [Planctomycetaceae bacterium]|nr:SMI1/KNR4 family protein [Planctomycetaceae bacterium]
MWDTSFPPLLAELHQLEFDYADGEGMDFEPFDEFLPAEENAAWFRAWTGNALLDGAQFRVFGQDGTGGYAAFWLTDSEQGLEAQPVVFLGSEGEIGVVAINFDEYLWLLAAGIGPFEAIAYPDLVREPNVQFTAFARAHSKRTALSAVEVRANASVANTEFQQHIEGQCR